MADQNTGTNRRTRRQWLRMSTGALLGAGILPGCAGLARRDPSSFRFVVLNDTHYFTPQCPAWFERVRLSIRALRPRPEFCLVLGDLSEHGTAQELGGMREALRSFKLDYHVVIGNHDHTAEGSRAAFEEAFPRSINYRFEHRGWQFIALDTTQGPEYQDTSVQPATLNWLDLHLANFSPAAPTVVFTHFPLGAGVKYRPANAQDIVARFTGFNVAAIFSGHFHGFTERRFGGTVLTTNRCCAISRANHDRTPEKGYFVCDAANGFIRRAFIRVTEA